MIRIEGTNRVGEKIWLQTNCLLTARAFIDELITYEYKNANDENIADIKKELKEYESMEGNMGHCVKDRVDLQTLADLQEQLNKAREIVGVNLPKMTAWIDGEPIIVTESFFPQIDKTAPTAFSEAYTDFMAQYANPDAVEDNSLGGVGYIHVTVPRGA